MQQADLDSQICHGCGHHIKWHYRVATDLGSPIGVYPCECRSTVDAWTTTPVETCGCRHLRTPQLDIHVSDNPHPHPHDTIDHPAHYGGDTTYEAIKVVEAWGLNFNLGNVLKYICRYRDKGGVDDLEKAAWYLAREVSKEKEES